MAAVPLGEDIVISLQMPSEVPGERACNRVWIFSTVWNPRGFLAFIL